VVTLSVVKPPGGEAFFMHIYIKTSKKVEDFVFYYWGKHAAGMAVRLNNAPIKCNYLPNYL